MVSFASDYVAGAHPAVLEALCRTNLENLPGYGEDRYCESAKRKIREACGLPDVEVEFLTGGTQTNQAVISAMLRDYEGVLSADTGHINVHEAGAIEYSGHKVIGLPHENGKIDAATVRRYAEGFYADGSREHMVYPGMVYISHPTEYGTLYRREELKALSEVCSRFGMTLFADGARLGYGLMSPETDVTLRDMAEFCDVFYIGGTKVGALCGEAVVFTRNNRPAHFTNSAKKRGALLAKGRLVGVQFDALFTDGLYYEIGRHGIAKAEELKKAFREKGYEFFLESPTNQQFILLEDRKMEELAGKVAFSVWEKADDTHTVARFVTSWSTTDGDIAYLKSIL